MTEKEFEALIKIEGYSLNLWEYSKGIWFCNLKHPDGAVAKSFLGSSREDALSMMVFIHYANN